MNAALHLDYPADDMSRFSFARTILEKRGIRCAVRLRVPVPGGLIHRLEIGDGKAEMATETLIAAGLMPKSVTDSARKSTEPEA